MEKEKNKVLKIVLKTVLAVVLITIIGIIIYMVRNYIIISNLQRIFSQYDNVTNYHTKTSYEDENGHTEIDYYRKDDKKALFIVNTNASGETTKMSTYDNGKRVDFFTETSDKKVAMLDSANSPDVVLSNGIDGSLEGFEQLLNYLRTHISVTEVSGRETFIVEGYMSDNMLYNDDGKCVSFIDKETGLEFMRKIDGRVEEKVAEFDSVDDSVFVEPNIGEYELLK